MLYRVQGTFRAEEIQIDQQQCLTDTCFLSGLVTSSQESPLFNYTLAAHDQRVQESIKSICPTEISVYPGDASRVVRPTSNELVLNRSDLTVWPRSVWKHSTVSVWFSSYSCRTPQRQIIRPQSRTPDICFFHCARSRSSFAPCCNSVAQVL